MKHRVVVTGLGGVTSLGLSLGETWQGLIAGRSGVAAIADFESAAFPSRVAAQVRDLNPLDFVENHKALKTMDKHTFMGVAAVAQAMADAGLKQAHIPPARIGLYLGLGMVDYDVEDIVEAARASLSKQGVFDWDQFARDGYLRIQPLWTIEMLPNIALCQIAILHNIQGPNLSLGSFGEAGSQAIGEALRAVQGGEVDVAIAGGVSFKVNPFSMARFSMLGLLSASNEQPTRACRPFDANRDGTVLGEGACIVVLEESSHALARGATPYAELVGYGVGSSAPNERGVGVMRAMQAALADAGIVPNQVDYINADAPGGVETDREEAWAITQLFASTLPVSASKSMLGHTMAASGPLSLAICIEAMQQGRLPPTINHTTPDPACALDCVPLQARAADVQVALSNARGLDGLTASLVVQRCDE